MTVGNRQEQNWNGISVPLSLTALQWWMDPLSPILDFCAANCTQDCIHPCILSTVTTLHLLVNEYSIPALVWPSNADWLVPVQYVYIIKIPLTMWEDRFLHPFILKVRQMDWIEVCLSKEQPLHCQLPGELIPSSPCPTLLLVYSLPPKDITSSNMSPGTPGSWPT